MSDQSFGIGTQELAILDLDSNRFAAIETDRVNPDCFAWEKPADRQRFEGSLTEPFLLPIDGDSVLIG